MNSIGIHFHPGEEVALGESKWWGDPDLPEDMDYPVMNDTPLTFICQIRLRDIAPYDTEGLLPKDGTLYFFAAIAEYVEKLEVEQDNHNGLGEWSEDSFAVLYAPEGATLQTCQLLYDDDETPVALPAERITFTVEDATYDGFKLLGLPYYDEVREEFTKEISLLQIDEQDSWGLRLYDCGMLNFLIKPSELKKREWGKSKFYFHSF